MEKKKVQSANIVYLIMGIFGLTSFIFCSYMTIDIFNTVKDKSIIFILIFTLLFMGSIAIILLIAYMKRQEFFIYKIKKDGIINFDEINKDFIQVKDDIDEIYFVKKEHHILYTYYELLHK